MSRHKVGRNPNDIHIAEIYEHINMSHYLDRRRSQSFGLYWKRIDLPKFSEFDMDLMGRIIWIENLVFFFYKSLTIEIGQKMGILTL